ncbi:hypothetical protein BD770DRAFT_411311 [Pilaira anomala]|nr:hypothetical protein BD770DRAFT_411311 [Pilaira anomala]
MAGGVAMTGAAMTGVAMIGIALTNTGAALVVVVMMDKTVVVMMFQQCNGFVKAMIKFCNSIFWRVCSILMGPVSFSSVLVYERFVQFNPGCNGTESWIDGSHLGRCHLKGKYYDQRLIVATTPQQLVILFFGEYVLSCSTFGSEGESSVILKLYNEDTINVFRCQSLTHKVVGKFLQNFNSWPHTDPLSCL